MKRFLHITLLLCTMLLTTTEVGAWKFTTVTPESGSKVESLQYFDFVIGSGNGLISAKSLTLVSNNGTEYTVYMTETYTGTILGNTSNPITADGTYTLTIPEGYYDDWSMRTSEKMVYTWTIGDGDGGTPGGDSSDQGGGDSTPEPWDIPSSITPNEGNITSLSSFSFTLPDEKNGYSISDNDLITLIDSNKENYTISYLAINGKTVSGTLSSTIKKPGRYTLTISKDAIVAEDGSTNNEFEFTWVIEGETPIVGTWEFTSVEPAEGTVESLHDFKFYGGNIKEAKPFLLELQGTGNTYEFYIYYNENNGNGYLYGSTTGNNVNPGTYTLHLAEGFMKNEDGEYNKEMIYTWTIEEPSTPEGSGWEFTSVTPEEGEVTEIYQIVLDEPAGTMWVDEVSAKPCNLTDANGNVVATYNLGENMSHQVAGSPSNYKTIVSSGTYTLTIPAGTFHINGEGNAAQTFTWTIKESEAEPWVFTGITPESGKTLKFLEKITFTMPEGTSLKNNVTLTIKCPDNSQKNAYININGTIGFDNTLKNPGTYTLTISAGTLKDDNNTDNAEMIYSWIVDPDPEYSNIVYSHYLGAENTVGKWATYSNTDNDVFITEPAVVYAINLKNGNISLNTINPENTSVGDGTFVPKNTGVLLLRKKDVTGAISIYSVKYKTINTESFSSNLLKPGNGSETTGDNCKFYRLAYKNFNTKTGLGFYYGANCNDGQAFTCKAGTAYLAVPNSAGARSFYMFDEDDETTGVNNVNENVNENHDVYNLAGQRVAGSHKGIVIVNGKKVVK